MGVFSVVLAILAVICAFLGPLFLGTTGGIIAAVAAVVAIALAVCQRVKNKKGGIAGIVIGVLAVILALSITNTTTAAFKELHNKALQYKPDGIWAQVSEDTTGGLLGIINKLPKDEASLNQLYAEMNELNAISGN